MTAPSQTSAPIEPDRRPRVVMEPERALELLAELEEFDRLAALEEDRAARRRRDAARGEQ